MNEYKITFSMFPLVGEDTINIKKHFSNCEATIKGNTCEEALKSFKEEKRKEGWYVATLRGVCK